MKTLITQNDTEQEIRDWAKIDGGVGLEESIKIMKNQNAFLHADILTQEKALIDEL